MGAMHEEVSMVWRDWTMQEKGEEMIFKGEQTYTRRGYHNTASLA